MSETLKHHFICSLCSGILPPRSVSTQCVHDFCSQCLGDRFPDCLKQTQVPCPTCDEGVVFETIVSLKSKQPKICSQLLDLKVRCKLCKWIGVVSTLQEHNSNCSGQQNNSSSNSNQDISEAEIGASFEKSSDDHQSSSEPNSGICS